MTDINTDLAKMRIRDRFKRCTGKRAVRALAKTIRPRGAVLNKLVDSILVAASETADQVVYDEARIRAGRKRMLFGLFTLAVTACSAWWQFDQAPDGIVDFVMTLAETAGILTGGWLLWTGRDLASEWRLQAKVVDEDIEAAQCLLRETGEAARPPTPLSHHHQVWALMVADAGVLLSLVAPTMLPESKPLVHLGVVAVGSLLVARICNDSIHATAKALRIVQVRHFHALLEGDGRRGIERAQVLRDTYGGAVGGRWPTSFGWKDYLPALLWCIPLLSLHGLLLGVRLLVGSADDSMALAVILAGAMALLTCLFALRQAVLGECLVPAIKHAKALVSVFPNTEQLTQRTNAWRADINRQLAQTALQLTLYLQPSRHGEMLTEVPALALPEAQAELLTNRSGADRMHAVTA